MATKKYSLTQKSGVKYYTTALLEEIKSEIFNLLKIVDKVARTHDIPYWIDGGTLLGAVRHGGFIPWDDDIDLCLLKKDYDRLLPLLQQYIKAYEPTTELLYYDDPKHPNWCVFLISKKYTVSYQGIKKPIRIDIFPVKLVTDNEEEIRKDRYITDTAYYFFIGRTKYFKDISKLYPLKDLKSALKQKIEFYHNTFYPHLDKNQNLADKSKLLVNYAMNDNYTHKDRGYFSYSDIFPLNYVRFEGNQFPAPNKLDRYLKHLYGDYMKLPPLQDRRPSHNNTIYKRQITAKELRRYVDSSISYFYYANKKWYKFYKLYGQFLSLGPKETYRTIIRPFMDRGFKFRK